MNSCEGLAPLSYKGAKAKRKRKKEKIKEKQAQINHQSTFTKRNIIF